jgi:hypothetical protein
MTGIRRGWFGGLAALLLAGCASYPATYYAPGDAYGYAGEVQAGGAYTYGGTYVDDGVYWSPAWSVYYSTVLYPPYWRVYDPWYTPGFYYGYGYAPGAGWRIGWSSWRYDPWWGGGWYSPYRHGWYAYRPAYFGYGYGYGYGHGYGGWYGNHGYRSNSNWRDLERRYGRRAYDPDRRAGGDRRASDEADRIARRQGAGQYDPRPGGNAWRDGTQERSGAPSAYDRRRDDTAGRNQPSRFGNPAGAAPPARNDNTGDSGGLGRRSNGWVAPAPSDGGYSRRGAPPQGEPAEAVDLESRRDRGGYDNRWRGGDQAPASTERAPRQWTSGGDPDRSSGQGYRRIETPRAWGGSEPAQRAGWRDGSAGGSDLGRVPAPRDEGSRYQRQSMPGYERQAAPRYEQQASPRYERQAAPRQEYSAPAPRFEQPARYEAPSRGDDRGSRQDSPRFEAPSRDDGGGRSASRELERIQRDDEQP